MHIQRDHTPVIFFEGGASVSNDMLTNHFDKICRYLEEHWDVDSIRFDPSSTHRTFCEPIKGSKKQKKLPLPQEDRSK
jgi:hypothetical protein